MTASLSRSALLGAGLALGLATLVLLATGGGDAKDAPLSVPATLQAPTPTLDPVTTDASPEAKKSGPTASSAPVQAPSNATASQEKDNQ